MATPKVPKGGIARDFSQAVVDRVSGLRTAAGKAFGSKPSIASHEQQAAAFDPPNGYFPAGTPLTPIAPEGSTTGRAYDFPPFVNLTYAPRSEQGENAIDFPTLIRMASPADGGLDILRLAIETRKDQMANQRWHIGGEDKDDDGGDDARQVEQWLRKPDGVHTFRQWMRLILEDHFVIDAPTIYFSNVGNRPLAEIVSGDTIKLYITGNDGRTPLPPLPAYAQIIKGTPAEDYTLDEMGYYPYNLRPNRMYGMSRVEQVLITVHMALNRQLSQLSFFTAGTVPDGFIELPKEFTLSQVQQWQEMYDAMLAGQLDKRRQLIMLPQGANYKATKTEILKDLFDEWLARIVCYCFSLSPQAFVKEMNRATSATAKQAAQEEGLEPTKLWFEDVMNDVLVRLGFPDLRWQWEDEEITDPETKAKVVQTYYGGTTGTAAKIITLAEAREYVGFPAATPEQMKELQPEPVDATTPPPNGAPTNGNAKPAGNGAAPTNRVAKLLTAGTAPSGRSLPRQEQRAWDKRTHKQFKGKRLKPLARNTTLAEHTERRIHAEALAVLKAQKHHVRVLLTGKIAKAAGDDLQAFLDALDAGGIPWDDDAREQLRSLIADIAADRAAAAMQQVSDYLPSDADLEALLHQANERAVAWAESRVGNLVTDVTATTRDAINELTAAAIENGWSNAQLAETLDDAWAFGEDRAMMIARTETAFAETQGTLAGYAESGVVEAKGWSSDADACEECAPLDGEEVPLDDAFSDGSDGPPQHPACRCSAYPVVMAAEEATAG